MNETQEKRLKEVTWAVLLFGMVLLPAALFCLTGCASPSAKQVAWRPDSVRPVVQNGRVVACVAEGYEIDRSKTGGLMVWTEVQCPPASQPETHGVAPALPKRTKAQPKVPRPSKDTHKSPTGE